MKNKLTKASNILNSLTIPTIPEEVLKLKEELNRKYPNTVTIANLISHNPELLAEFLNLANANLTNSNSEIKDAKNAVNSLGLDEIYNIFLAISLTDIAAQTDEEKQILQHGTKAGLAAAELSYWVFDVSRSEAYMAGLMQNVGAIYLSRFDPENYLNVFNYQLRSPIEGYKKEVEQYGTAHTYLGTYLAKKWHIDPNIYQAILMHHYPDYVAKVSTDKVRNIIALVMAANYVASSATAEQYITQELKDYRNLGLRQLNLPENAMKAASAAVAKWSKSENLSSGSH